MSAIAPEVLWAQRSSDSEPKKNLIYLTVRIIDPEEPKIDLTSTNLKIEATASGKKYDLDIEFFDEIDEKASKYEITGSHIFFVLIKKKLDAEFWPRLTKLKVKYHYIKTDFDKWVDEDEQDEKDDEDLQNSMNDLNSFGGAGDGQLDFAKLAAQSGMGGMAGMGGMGGMGGVDLSQFGDLGNAEQYSSSDDEEEVKEDAGESEPKVEEA